MSVNERRIIAYWLGEWLSDGWGVGWGGGGVIKINRRGTAGLSVAVVKKIKKRHAKDFVLWSLWGEVG